MTSSAFHAVAEKVTVDSETMGFGVKLTCPVPDGAEVIRISGYPGDFSPALVNLAVFHYQPPGAELSSRIDFAGITNGDVVTFTGLPGPPSTPPSSPPSPPPTPPSVPPTVSARYLLVGGGGAGGSGGGGGGGFITGTLRFPNARNLQSTSPKRPAQRHCAHRTRCTRTCRTRVGVSPVQAIPHPQLARANPTRTSSHLFTPTHAGTDLTLDVDNGDIAITVGAGGTGGCSRPYYGTTNIAGCNLGTPGGVSSIAWGGSVVSHDSLVGASTTGTVPLKAFGGGIGGYYDGESADRIGGSALNGASGGGATFDDDGRYGGPGSNSCSETCAGQGTSGSLSGRYGLGGGGGGGGACSPATLGANEAGGGGGDGCSSDISGTATFYGGGGAGGVNMNDNANHPSSQGFGGQGGGGDGSTHGCTPSGSWMCNVLDAYAYGMSDGTDGLGGGGGGGDPEESQGGNGGSGVVIIRYSGSARFSGGVTRSHDCSLCLLPPAARWRPTCSSPHIHQMWRIRAHERVCATPCSCGTGTGV